MVCHRESWGLPTHIIYSKVNQIQQLALGSQARVISGANAHHFTFGLFRDDMLLSNVYPCVDSNEHRASIVPWACSILSGDKRPLLVLCSQVVLTSNWILQSASGYSVIGKVVLMND